ncbi:MAG: hypothetical protein IJR88_01910 [Clostridia bacterium]|nr:hypothetical protein [Clostridia bacterium]
MKKNLKTLVERTNAERPQCLVDMNEIDLIEASGMVADLRHKKSAHLAALWKLDQRETVLIPMGGSDLEGFSQLTFWIFCERAVGSVIRMLFDTTPEGKGEAGYVADIPLTKKGWNHVSLAMLQLPSTGDARSWNYVSNIRLTRVKGRKLEGAALYLDSFFLWENTSPAAYELIPDLHRAIVFSERGAFSLVRGKRIPNAPFGGDHSPEINPKTGEYWVPLSPIVAGFVRTSEADSKRKSLAFTYRNHSYVFLAGTPAARVDGAVKPLKFAPAEQGGGLYVPISFAAEFFGRKFILEEGGLLVLSNRKTWFLKSGEALRREILAATTFPSVNCEEIIEQLRTKFFSPGKTRLLFSKEEVGRLRKSLKADEKLREAVSALELDAANTKEIPSNRLLALSLSYLATGKKKLPEAIKVQFGNVSLNIDNDLAKFGHSSYAIAMAYDASKGVLTEAEKAVMERKLIRSCLRPGLSYFNGKRATASLDSLGAAALACGMTACALVMADTYPETAKKLLEKSLEHLKACFLASKPDKEGRLDLLLGTRALDVALETTYGCAALPGVKEDYAALFKDASENPAESFVKLCARLFPSE